MVTLSALWLPILVSAIFVFIAANILWMALPFDFEKQGKRGGPDQVHTAKGRGRAVTIIVEGPLIRVAIERMPITTNLVKEELEWPGMEGTASRFHSPWS